MSLLVKFLAKYYKSKLRGSWRLTDFLTRRFDYLHDFTIETENGKIFGDLRIPSSRAILANPKIYSGEDIVMQNFIKQSDVVFDIGAHLGLFTLLMSKLAGEKGRVYAFEPNPTLLPSLTKTIDRLPNVKLFPVALSDSKGKRTLFIPEDPSMASISNWTNGNAGEVAEVICEVEMLDNLLNENKVTIPQFIKCDVEGAELSIFNGAKTILNRTDAPVVMFEIIKKAAISFNKNTTDYFDFIESLEKPKYKFYEILPQGIQKLKSRDIDYANILAVPEVKGDSCKSILV